MDFYNYFPKIRQLMKMAFDIADEYRDEINYYITSGGKSVILSRNELLNIDANATKQLFNKIIFDVRSQLNAMSNMKPDSMPSDNIYIYSNNFLNGSVVSIPLLFFDFVDKGRAGFKYLYVISIKSHRDKFAKILQNNDSFVIYDEKIKFKRIKSEIGSRLGNQIEIIYFNII